MGATTDCKASHSPTSLPTIHSTPSNCHTSCPKRGILLMLEMDLQSPSSSTLGQTLREAISPGNQDCQFSTFAWLTAQVFLPQKFNRVSTTNIGQHCLWWILWLPFQIQHEQSHLASHILPPALHQVQGIFIKELLQPWCANIGSHAKATSWELSSFQSLQILFVKQKHTWLRQLRAILKGQIKEKTRAVFDHKGAGDIPPIS